MTCSSVFSADHHSLQLPCSHQRVSHVANARTRCQRRQERFDFIFSSANRLAQVERNQRRKRGGLAGIRACLDLLGKTGSRQFPKCGRAIQLRHRDHAQLRPELGQCAQNSRFRDFVADLVRHVGGRKHDLGGEDFIYCQRQRRNLDRPGRYRRLLPCLVAAQGENVGENSSGDDKVGNVGPVRTGGAEQVQRDGIAIRNQPCQQAAGVIEFGQLRGRRRLAQRGFHQRGRGRGYLRARRVQHQAGAREPIANIALRQQGFAILMPVGGARGGQLVGRRRLRGGGMREGFRGVGCGLLFVLFKSRVGVQGVLPSWPNPRGLAAERRIYV